VKIYRKYSKNRLNIVEKEKKCRKNFHDTVRFLVEHYPNVGFTKYKVKRVVNLSEDTGSVRELNYLAKISRSCFYGRIKASSIINYVQMLSLTL
jgi:hypothetical protein